MFATTSLSDLTAAVATSYNGLQPAVLPWAEFAIGVILVFLIIGFAVSLFSRRQRK